MTTYYKAVRPDGTDFRTRRVNYLTGGTIAHPAPGKKGSTDAAGYISVSVSATDCTGFSWPARLLEVEPVGPVWTPNPSVLPNKRAVKALRVVRELDATRLLGPQGLELVALVARARTITLDEARRLEDARLYSLDGLRSTSWYISRDAACDAGLKAGRRAAIDAAMSAARRAAGDNIAITSWDSAWDAAAATAWDTAIGLVTRDLIGKYVFTHKYYDPLTFTQERYDLLTEPWRRVIGKIHADDANLIRGYR